MGQYSGTVITDKGFALQLKVQAGLCNMVFNRAAAGDGRLPAGTRPEETTELVNERWPMTVAKEHKRGKEMVTIETRASNDSLEEGFLMTEVGLFAQDPDEGEVLYALTIAGDRPDYLACKEDVGGLEYVHFFQIIVGRDAVIEIHDTDLNRYVDREELEHYALKEHTHIPADIDGLTEWMTENAESFIKADEKGKPLGVAVLDDDGRIPADMLPGGGDASSVNGIRFRVDPTDAKLLQYSVDGGTLWTPVYGTFRQ